MKKHFLAAGVILGCAAAHGGVSLFNNSSLNATTALSEAQRQSFEKDGISYTGDRIAYRYIVAADKKNGGGTVK